MTAAKTIFKKSIFQNPTQNLMTAGAVVTILTTTALGLSSCASHPPKAEEPEAAQKQPQEAPQAKEAAQLKPGERETLPLIGDYKVHRGMLENGMKILVIEDHSSPTFAYQTWYSVGSRNEIPGRTGLAHLFEHMMFKETKNLKADEFDRIMESAGAEGTNAFTSNDYTAYVEEMPSDKLDLTARLEADRMVNLIVDENAFKTEREVVQNERRMRYENSPDGTMYHEILALAFTKHPYGWPVIGFQQDLDAMSAADATEFYKSWYSPNHATLVVAGNVNADQVFETARKYFGAYQPQVAPAREIPVEPEQTSPRRKTLRLPIQVEKLLMGYPIPAIASPDMPALYVLQSILSGGNSSRLHRALVETGLATSVESDAMAKIDPGLFLIGADMQKGKKGTAAEAVILREIARLAKEPVGEQELKRAKNILNFGFYEGFGSNKSIAQFVGSSEVVLGDFRKGLEIYRKSESVTADEVMAVAKKYLNPNRRNVILGVQK